MTVGMRTEVGKYCDHHSSANFKCKMYALVLLLLSNDQLYPCVGGCQALGMCKCHQHIHIQRTNIGAVISLPSRGQANANMVLIINLLYDDSNCPP